jgi:uncharacterized membrane protein
MNASGDATDGAASRASDATLTGCLIDLPDAHGSVLVWEALAVLTSSLLVLCYAIAWQRAVRRRPFYTMRGTMKQVRRSWVAAHLHKGMVPVNTLRDLIRSSQWFASSALLVAVGACGFLASAESAVARNSVLHMKVVGLVGACGLTFIFFFHATRYWTHVSLLINCPDIDGVPVTEELVYRVMSRGADMWSLGMKTQICVALPMLVWGFGPGYLVGATAGVLLVLRLLDFEVRGLT